MIVLKPSGFGQTRSTTMNIGAASPAAPSTSLLKSGYEWAPAFDRYVAGKRATSCALQPSPGTQISGNGGMWLYGGCTMNGGVAWNQVKGLGNSEAQEFGPGALPLLKAYVAPPPPPPVMDPCAASLSACNTSYTNMLNAFPQYKPCLTAQDAEVYRQLCCAAAIGKIQPAAAFEQWVGYATSRCPAVSPPPPPPQQVSPPPPPPPPSVDHPVDLPEPMDVSDGGDTAIVPVPQPSSAMKTWGPIVGIGLIAAVALTLARKKRGKKSRGSR